LTAAAVVTTTVVAGSPDETRALGERLGRALRAGDVVGLVGPLGAGKTTFAQGIAAGAGVPADRHVASPTFSLVNEHPGRMPFVHADLYRIADDAELGELGIDDAFDRAAVAIEWIDRFPQLLPRDHLIVTLARANEGPARQLRFEATGPRARALLAAVAAT
jgi:tRNA threonylcarbamoyladenosine biosynthesis protein TsaE